MHHIMTGPANNSFNFGGTLGSQQFWSQDPAAKELDKLMTFLEKDIAAGMKEPQKALDCFPKIEQILKDNPHLRTPAYEMRMEAINKAANETAKKTVAELEALKADPNRLNQAAQDAGRSPEQHLKSMEALAAAAAGIAAAMADLIKSFFRGIAKMASPRPN